MDNRKKAAIGVAAGAAAAATAVGIAAVKKHNLKPTVFHVRPGEEGWTLGADGASSPSTRHETKRQAVNAARELAAGSAPSRLVIHRRDGSVQKEHSYQPGA